jgi:L-histidine Nalpha-methyltransferase
MREELMIATAMATDVIAGLSKLGQKELPSKYLYDTVGSRLFDVITELPEYGLTRAEERILNRHAGDIVKRLPEDLAVAELGSGGGRKTRRILEALCSSHPTAYFPIEISPTALAMCEREVGDIPSISIVGVEHEYLDGLQEVARMRAPRQRLLVLFLGSTIGNFDPPAGIPFLRKIREMLAPGDLLLLGTDLEKSVPLMIAAYDDPLGVTAAFNRNLLVRINRELGGDFDIDAFGHRASWNAEQSRVEMHLVSRLPQRVRVAAAQLELEMAEGESIWTESSYKYRPEGIARMLERTGFRLVEQWTDREDGFALTLVEAA